MLFWQEFYWFLAYYWLFEYILCKILEIIEVPHTKRLTITMTINCYKEFTVNHSNAI